jgi:hypothetical protein
MASNVCECDKDRDIRHKSLPPSHRFLKFTTSNNEHDAPITVPHFSHVKSNPSPPEPLRLIVPLVTKPPFGVFPGHVVVWLARLSIAPISYKYPVHEARRSSLSPLPTILLFFPQFLNSPLCLTFIILPHRLTSN